MSKLAVLYATTEGQTMKIASHIAARFKDQGHDVELHHVDALEDFPPAKLDGVLLGGSIHEGHYQRYFERWIKAHRSQLAACPSGLFTVCLGIVSANEKEREEARAFPRQLSERTSWTPGHTAVFAGALKYTQYSWLKRALMKQIAKQEGAATDTSTDHEYTQWSEVNAFADAFVASLQKPASRTEVRS
jgi:menaquinone-dependent protoporphyrinogen oxidase